MNSLKKILTVVLVVLNTVLAFSQNNKEANARLLEAVNNNDIEKVIQACNDGADFCTFTDSQKASMNFDNYFDLYQKIENVATQIQFVKYIIELSVIEGNKTIQAGALTKLAMIYHSMGDYQSAESLYKESLEIMRQVLGNKNPAYATSLNNLAYLYQEMGDYLSAETLYKESLEIYRQVLGNEHPNYAIILEELAGLYIAMGDYQSAEPLLKESLEIHRQVLGKEHPDYAEGLINLACLYIAKMDYSSAEPLYKEYLELKRKSLGEKHPDYAIILKELAGLYIAMGDYQSAEPLLKENLEIHRQELGEKHPDYAMSLNNLAGLHRGMGDYQSAESLYKEALKIRQQVLGERHPDYAESLNDLANLYTGMGDYQSAESLYKEALKIRQQVLGERHPDYAESLNNLACFYQEMGDYLSAESLYKESLEITHQVLGNQHPDYATKLNNLAQLYCIMGDYKSAEPLLKESLDIKRQVLGEQHPDIAKSLNNLAYFYQEMGDYQSAESLYKESLEIYRRVLGKEHLDYAMSLNNLAELYRIMRDYKYVESLYKEALDITRKSLGEGHQDYVDRLNNLALFYHNIGDYLNAFPLYNEGMNLICNLVESNFDFITESQRELYWNKYDITFFEKIYPNFVHSSHNIKNDVVAFAYNNELFYKGLLLNATLRVQRSILESGNSALIENYEQLRRVKERIIFLQQQPLDKQYGIDSLLAESQRLEKELVVGSREFRESRESWKVTWTDVQNSLKDGEVAIEFSSFADANDSTSRNRLVALMVRKGDTNPKYIDLCFEEDICSLLEGGADIAYTYFKKGKALKTKIWDPLSEYIKKGETVYFAPAGILHRINLSAIPLNDTTTIGDEHRMVQLTSTRQLALSHREEKQVKTAQVYGGIYYDADDVSLLASSREYPEQESRGRIFTQDGTRGGWGSLEGTAVEANDIGQLMKNAGVNARLLSGVEANEESFKALSGKSPNIIHIATHGFFLDTPKKVRSARYMFTDDAPKGVDPMLRSGLLFAGANRAWLGQDVITGIEDGVLTAKEISNIDLGKTGMVVMSACETGLGDVNSGEGVFGLQRGMKLAGVETLVMSLWKVDDAATALMMTTFYKELLSGKGREESFKKAVSTVRNHKDFMSPAFWAGFILVD